MNIMDKAMLILLDVAKGTYDDEYTKCILQYAREHLVSKEEKELIDTYFEIQKNHGRDAAISWLATAICNVKECDRETLCHKKSKK